MEAEECIYFVEDVPNLPNKTYGANCFRHGDAPHYCPAIKYGKCRSFEKKMKERDVQEILKSIVENDQEYIVSILFPFAMYEDIFRKYHEQYHNDVTTYIVSKLDHPKDVGGILL
jgi:hypothetical protein